MTKPVSQGHCWNGMGIVYVSTLVHDIAANIFRLLSAWNLGLIPGNAIQWLYDLQRAVYLFSASVPSFVKQG